MYRTELLKLEGVWTGTENVIDGDATFDATGRIVFQTVFDGRFLLCDYVQTAPERPMSVAHGVFRVDEKTNALTVTWFRSPAATGTQQADAVAEGDKPVFMETVDGRTTRTTYAVAMDKLTIRTDLLVEDGEWKPILSGTYRRR
jgi:hypothetical protein